MDEEKVPDPAFRAKVSRLAANYALASRAYRPLPEAWEARTGEPLPEKVRASLARVRERAAGELWAAAPPGRAREFAAVRLRLVAAAAVHPKAWPGLKVGLRQRAACWEGESLETVRDRWLDRATVEALADKGSPPGPLAPDWYRRWSNRVGQVLKRELDHPPVPPSESETLEDAPLRALAFDSPAPLGLPPEDDLQRLSERLPGRLRTPLAVFVEVVRDEGLSARGNGGPHPPFAESARRLGVSLPTVRDRWREIVEIVRAS